MIQPCKISCAECPYKDECKDVDDERLYYAHDYAVIRRSDFEEVRKKGVVDLSRRCLVIPLIILKPKTRKKLTEVLSEIHSHNLLKRVITSKMLADTLDTSIYNIKKRIYYLKERGYLEEIMVRKSKNRRKVYLLTKKTADGIADIRDMIRFWIGLFSNKYGHSPTITPADTAGLTRAIQDYSKEEVRDFLRVYIELDDKFLREAGYQLRFFHQNINKLIVSKKDKEPTSKSISEEQLKWYEEGKSKGKWNGVEPWAIPYENLLQQKKKLEQEKEEAKDEQAEI